MQATYIEVEAAPRYWEDSTVNGKEDAQGKLMPFRFGDKWCFWVRLSDGWIVNWPEGTTADVHFKVCDQGEYWLSTEECRVAKWKSDYVPDAFLCHGDTGYGDYIIFKVGADGKIEGWQQPDIDPDQWGPELFNAELSGPRPLAAEGSRSNDELGHATISEKEDD